MCILWMKACAAVIEVFAHALLLDSVCRFHSYIENGLNIVLWFGLEGSLLDILFLAAFVEDKNLVYTIVFNDL